MKLIIGIFVALFWACRQHVTATIGNHPISVPVLGIAAVLAGLALAVALAALVRVILRDGLALGWQS